MDNRPIGIFDSGLGGLTVVKEITRLLPNESFVYLGDTARTPYGTRSKETIIEFALEDVNFLLSRDVKCIVIACNTVSSYAFKILEKRLGIPVFEVVGPACTAATKVTHNKRIGVIGTRATICSDAYQKRFSILDPEIEVHSTSCPLFVPFIEEGVIGGTPLSLIAKDYLREIKNKGVDTLVLGCTHYPIIRNIIQKEVGKDVKLVDSGGEVAKIVKDYLIKNDMLRVGSESARNMYFVTDLTPRFRKVAREFFGGNLNGKIAQVNL